MYLKPSQIFYTQSSIGNRFGGGSHRKQPIGETLDDICNGSCSVSRIPRITVVKKDNKWFTLDNRRLWVFRHLERLGKCTEIAVNVGTDIPSRKLTTANGGVYITVRNGSPGGSWHYKPSVKQLNITSEAKPEISSTPSSKDKDTGKPKNVSSEDIIKANADTDNNDPNYQSRNKDEVLDNQGVTNEPNKIAKDRELNKLSTGLIMSSHISRQTFDAYVASTGRKHLSWATNLGESYPTKRKRSVSPQVDVCERNKSRGAIIDKYPFFHQTDHHKRACLFPTHRQYNIDSNNSPISAKMIAMVRALNESKKYQNWPTYQRNRSYFRTVLNQSSTVPSFPVQGLDQSGSQQCVAKGRQINSTTRPDMDYTDVNVLDDDNGSADESDGGSSYTSYKYMVDSADDSNGENSENDNEDEGDVDSWESDSAPESDYDSFCIVQGDASDSVDGRDSESVYHDRTCVHDSADISDGGSPCHANEYASNSSDESDSDSSESDRENESEGDSFYHAREHVSDSTDESDDESFYHVNSWMSLFGCAF